jgi:hypothetical protein
MVDWSASQKKRHTGKDSVWYCVGWRAPHVHRMTRNPANRDAATRQLIRHLRALVSRRKRVLVGFDFPLGYPAGFAASLGLAPPCWRSTWRLIAKHFCEDPTEPLDRFAVASRLNGRYFGAPFPFWGMPWQRNPLPFLTHRKPPAPDHVTMQEHRVVESRRGVGGAQPAWKLYGNGSVGSQALLGIPRVRRIREHLAFRSRTAVWPFERIRRQTRVVITEIWPSLPALAIATDHDRIKDRAQVMGMVRYFSAIDRFGRLSCLLRPRLSPIERSRVASGEAWMLGVR